MSTRLIPVFVLAFILVFSGSINTQAQAHELLMSQTPATPLVEPRAHVQGWVQSNVSGFGNIQNNQIEAMGVYEGQLYAGVTGNPLGGQIWRTSDGLTWSVVNADGFGDPNNFPISFAVFNNIFYLGIYNAVSGAEIFATTNGLDWTNVMAGGFGDTEIVAPMNMVSFDGYLYAGAIRENHDEDDNEIWRSSNGLDWTNVVPDNFGLGSNFNFWSFEIFNGLLYATTNGENGGAIYRTSNGTTWSPITTDSFGDGNISAFPCLATFDGYLYVCARSIGEGIGAQVWRSSSGDVGSWVMVASGGLNDTDYSRPNGLIVSNNALYLTITVRNGLGGTKGDVIWRTTDGTNWGQDMANGWGDPNNLFLDYSDKSAAVFKGSLFVATYNSVAGGQVWERLLSVFIPLIVK